jgi:hypothetical protein
MSQATDATATITAALPTTHHRYRPTSAVATLAKRRLEVATSAGSLAALAGTVAG